LIGIKPAGARILHKGEKKGLEDQMKFWPISVTLAGALLLASPVEAQRNGGPSAGHAGPRGGAAAAPRGNSGAPRGPATWGDFHHNEAPVRISPRRFGSTNFPVPNGWRGNVRSFDSVRWQGGQWLHVSHVGRLGWWWVVGPDWYFYDAPVYPYPDIYTPPGEGFGWWYWCDSSQEYYPYVTYCSVPWQRVLPRD
jgi:hypothetical protein